MVSSEMGHVGHIFSLFMFFCFGLLDHVMTNKKYNRNIYYNKVNHNETL